MERNTIGISVAILNYLKDAEYHTITATTLNVGNFFNLKKSTMNEMYASRKLTTKNDTFSSKKIYTQVQLVISSLRKAKFIHDFPGTKGKGIFAITNKGSILVTKHPNEIKNTLNLELNKHSKKTKYTKN